ncbi:MAG: Hsp20 family protein [Defluviicoccus sp.]|nr:Hsp20 family protein [Defluviicoccus sp.]
MRAFDLSPLFSNTVGFDRMARLLEQVPSEAAPSYPPYDIEKTGENAYCVTLAVAGFGDDDISIEVKENRLTVTGKPAGGKSAGDAYLHRGIPTGGFERRFDLADHIRVTGAALDKGLLHIDLVREVPEALKPRTIAIDSGGRKRIDRKAS